MQIDITIEIDTSSDVNDIFPTLKNRFLLHGLSGSSYNSTAQIYTIHITVERVWQADQWALKNVNNLLLNAHSSHFVSCFVDYFAPQSLYSIWWTLRNLALNKTLQLTGD